MRFDVAGVGVGIMSAMLVDLAADPSFSIPARQYVQAGRDIAYDCEELVVHSETVTSSPTFGGSGFTERTREDVVWTATWLVTVVRCIPAPENETLLIPATVLDTSGRVILNDGGALIRAATAGWQRGALLPGCTDLVLGPLEWGTPDGMLIGTTLTIKVQL